MVELSIIALTTKIQSTRHEDAKHLSVEWSKSSETPIGQHLSVIDPK